MNSNPVRNITPETMLRSGYCHLLSAICHQPSAKFPGCLELPIPLGASVAPVHELFDVSGRNLKQLAVHLPFSLKAHPNSGRV